MLIDTHAHLYISDFAGDRKEIIANALKNDVSKIVLPNIDADSIAELIDFCDAFPSVCFPLMGLHPTSVKDDYREQLKLTEAWLDKRKFWGIGEIGIDLYWDKTYIEAQRDAFRIQLQWARSLNLPAAIHVRNSFDEVYEILETEQNGSLKGVFHCFGGGYNEARKIVDAGFYLGIGGVVTFKNSNLDEVLRQIDPQHIVLETDSPYLAPVPFRGRRNESAYIIYIAQKIGEIYNIEIGEVERITTQNAEKLFGI